MTHDQNPVITGCYPASSGYAQILGKLNSIGAVNAFLYTFDHPIMRRYGDRFPNPLNWTFRSYSYGEKVFNLPGEEQRMSTPEVFNNPYLCQDRQRILVVADLFPAETQYGIALFEPKDEAFFNDLELVTYQISSAVRTLDILKKQEELLKKQEKLLDELHTTNLALDRISTMDELTRVYNRKGFYPAADALINDPQYQGQPFIICYADMDRLKMVNDTYSHAEGDFTVNLVARCLEYALGETAVIGRMSGDEFAAIVPVASGVAVEALRARKEAYIQRFNESKEKPYPFGVSLGMLECVCGNSYDLKAALDKADDLLYLEKREKG